MESPVISTDNKKKELVGDFKNHGKELCPKGDSEKVRVHDFKIPELRRVASYGIYDIANNICRVNIGIDYDTSALAVESIRRWWYSVGKGLYPNASKLMVMADGGGSNGCRVKLWKLKLQKLADETGLAIQVNHFPLVTGKWNKI